MGPVGADLRLSMHNNAGPVVSFGVDGPAPSTGLTLLLVRSSVS
jgi:hypothetical protein